MKTQDFTAKMVALVALGSLSFAPVRSFAGTYPHHTYSRHHATTHRQHTKNTWRNAAYGAGVLGVLGLISHNGTLATLGLAGAGYSALRYEHDRKSQNRIQHHH
ncbi:MAG TPA: hypothetical protein VGL56_02180 [Fimbriimonadaceae bacterium]|jgi:hypothetical protein